METTLNPTFKFYFSSKIGIYMGVYHFSWFCSKNLFIEAVPLCNPLRVTRLCNLLHFSTALKTIIFLVNNCEVFLIFAKNVDFGYTLEPPQCEAVLTSTYNLCFRAKIRENVYPCKPEFYYIKVGYKGVYSTRICYHDVKKQSHNLSLE